MLVCRSHPDKMAHIWTLFTNQSMQIPIRTTRIAPTLFNLFYFYPDTDGRILIHEDDMKMRNRGLTFTVCGKINSYKKQLNYNKQQSNHNKYFAEIFKSFISIHVFRINTHWVCSGILLISSAFQEQEKTQIPLPFKVLHSETDRINEGLKEDKVEWSSELSLASNSVSLCCSFRKICERMLKGVIALYSFLLNSKENDQM